MVGGFTWKDIHTLTVGNGGLKLAIQNTVETGLTASPEDMKRAFNEDAILKLAGQALGMSPDRLRELAQAEKEGRLVVLPCEIGSPVYSHARKLDGADYVRETEFWWSDIPQIGKTVFLTREAAEAALDAMGGENNA